MKDCRINFAVTKEMKKQLSDLKENTLVSESAIIRQALKEYLEKQKK